MAYIFNFTIYNCLVDAGAYTDTLRIYVHPCDIGHKTCLHMNEKHNVIPPRKYWKTPPPCPMFGNEANTPKTGLQLIHLILWNFRPTLFRCCKVKLGRMFVSTHCLCVYRTSYNADYCMLSPLIEGKSVSCAGLSWLGCWSRAFKCCRTVMRIW